MQLVVFSGPMRPRYRLASFTLVELLTVMVIISILAALILEAGKGVLQKSLRSRATAEIQGMGSALESYKTDNGIYPPSDGVLLTNNYSLSDGSSSGSGSYQTNSGLLFIALTGQSNFTATPSGGTKDYLPSLKINQVGNPSSTYSYLKDPWNYSYGYSTGTTNGATTPSYPFNGSGFFDLWSTGGLLNTAVNTNAWISNWQ